MTPQEAIITLKREFLGDSEFMELAKQMGANALEKQIPKKPINFENEAYLCPNCRRNNFYNGTETLNKTNFCNYCGQRLDWSE